jgi:hypothetical protein
VRKRLIKLGVALAAISALAVGGSALASASQKASTPSTPAVTQEQQGEQSQAVDTDNVQQGDQSAPDATAADESKAIDTDNVQQGDQSGTDQPGEAASSESEQATSESGPSDGPGGYADTNPNADTQQQGEH